MGVDSSRCSVVVQIRYAVGHVLRVLRIPCVWGGLPMWTLLCDRVVRVYIGLAFLGVGVRV